MMIARGVCKLNGLSLVAGVDHHKDNCVYMVACSFFNVNNGPTSTKSLWEGSSFSGVSTNDQLNK